jgi:hypothetical protein
MGWRLRRAARFTRKSDYFRLAASVGAAKRGKRFPKERFPVNSEASFSGCQRQMILLNQCFLCACVKLQGIFNIEKQRESVQSGQP